MLEVYKTTAEGLLNVDADAMDETGNWISLAAPTSEELHLVSSKTGIALEMLRYPLDNEERPRIEYDDGRVLIIIHVPIEEQWTEVLAYNTIPLGIILTDYLIVTVSLVENQVITQFAENRVKGFSSFKRNRFLLQILFRTAVLYLHFLRQIDKKSRDIEIGLQQSTENKEVIKLLELGKSLVYFTTSLKSNDLVMEKLLKTWNSNSPSELKRAIQFYPEDEELLEDVLVENKQAIQMAEIYSSILNSMMDAFASIISNNLNLVMQFLTVVTIVLALPTMVASFYGMNVALPFQHIPMAFWGTVGISIALSSGAIYLFKKKRML